MPVLPALRFLTGRTALDDVAALRTAFAKRLVLRGLLSTRDRLSASAAEDGEGRAASPLPLLVPITPGEDKGQIRSDLARRITRVPARIDLAPRTPGFTTGTGRLIAMSAVAPIAPACATHVRLGGPGAWFLPLPAHHVAGPQILIRSLEVRTEPVVVDTSAGFSSATLMETPRSARRSTEAAASRLYVSLVLTQLVRVLQDPQARRVLVGTDVVLLGGTATDPALLAWARGAGVTVVATYGMSEAGGGCVYNGCPLKGVEIAIRAPDVEGAGRILISGSALAEDYLNTPSHSPAGRPNAGEGFHRSGTRHVLAISDRGRLHPDGRLEVLSRLDDVIITRDVKVKPRHVKEVPTGIDGMAEAYVVGLLDAQWGSAVVATVVLEAGRGPGGPKRLDGAALHEAARARLDGVHAPKRVLILEALPLCPSGKADRREIARLLAAVTTDATLEFSTPGP